MVYIGKSEDNSPPLVKKNRGIDLEKKEKSLSFLVQKKHVDNIKIKKNKKTKKHIFFNWLKKRQISSNDEVIKKKITSAKVKISKEENKVEEKIIKQKRKKRERLFLFLIPRNEKEYFIENLAMLFTSGMNVLLALDSIKQEMKSSQMKAVIDRMKEDIETGTPMWQILKDTKFFPSFVISLIKIGEGSGNLGKNLKVISVQQKKDREFTSKIRSAMMYPGFVLSLTLIVGIGIAWFILPRLALVFDQLKVELPLITKILISFGTFIGQYGTIVVPSFIVALFVILYFTFIFSRTKFIGQFLLFSFPGIKKLIQETELARMGYIIGTLLQAGLPIRNAMESLVEAATFYKYKNLYSHLKKSIENGDTFRQGFDSYKKSRKLVPSTVAQMIMMGENSGQLPETFFAIGENFEEKIENTTKNLSTILEPVLLVIVWLGVVAVALAVILPIYSLIGGLNNQTTNSAPASPPVVSETITIPEKLADENVGYGNDTVAEKKLEIKKTGTGFLNVRGEGNIKGKIVAKVKPGEQFDYQEEIQGWYKIILSDGTDGWVSGEYVEIFKKDNQDIINNEE